VKISTRITIAIMPIVIVFLGIMLYQAETRNSRLKEELHELRVTNGKTDSFHIIQKLEEELKKAVEDHIETTRTGLLWRKTAEKWKANFELLDSKHQKEIRQLKDEPKGVGDPKAKERPEKPKDWDTKPDVTRSPEEMQWLAAKRAEIIMISAHIVFFEVFRVWNAIKEFFGGPEDDPQKPKKMGKKILPKK